MILLRLGDYTSRVVCEKSVSGEVVTARVRVVILRDEPQRNAKSTTTK